MVKFKVYFWKRLPSKIFKDIKEKYKNRQKDYMNVYICDTYEEMYNLCDKLENIKLERDYAGRTYCYNRNFYDIKTNEYVKTSPQCGYIALNKQYFWMDVITHESTHAVIGYFNRKTKDEQKIFIKTDDIGNIINDDKEIDEKEELFCYMVGNIADQIAAKYDEIFKEGNECYNMKENI